MFTYLKKSGKFRNLKQGTPQEKKYDAMIQMDPANTSSYEPMIKLQA